MFKFAEFVFPGHPDKLSDAIADGIVQEARKRDHRALVGVEVAVHCNDVFITGRVACNGFDPSDIEAMVREVYQSAGYDESWLPHPEKLDIHNVVCVETLEEAESDLRSFADDQSVCVGYANAIEATNFLPPEHYLANRLGRKISELRTIDSDLGLGPDGKIVVTMRKKGERFTLHALSCSLQHRIGDDRIRLKRALRELVAREMQTLSDESECFAPDLPESIALNGAGNFEIGGPEGDNGLAGKKLAIDNYGPHVPIGGGALSGKDFFKVDRAGALHARRVAKAVVLTAGVPEVLVHFCWHPGNRAGEIMSISTTNGQELDAIRWRGMFDLSLEVSGVHWPAGLDLIEIARYGHFTNPDHPWETVRFSDQRNNSLSKPVALNGFVAVAS